MAMTVAIIDDDETLGRSVARLLSVAGMDARAFVSAEEFLASPSQRRFGCLLLDIQLTGMSGPELHRRMLEAGDRRPVIYITAHHDPAAEAEARRLGCAGFFKKSDPGMTIIERLRELERESSTVRA
jgi:FixJ family two-component response regulator